MARIDDLLRQIADDVSALFWSAKNGSLHATWRGRSLELRKAPHKLLVEGLVVSVADDVAGLYEQAQGAFLRCMVDNIPHVVARRLVLGSNWCCAVQVSEVLISENGYITEYLRKQPEPSELIADACDFRVKGGRLLLGSGVKLLDSVPIATVYQALFDAFLAGESMDEISADWEDDVLFDSSVGSN